MYWRCEPGAAHTSAGTAGKTSVLPAWANSSYAGRSSDPVGLELLIGTDSFADDASVVGAACGG